MSIPALETATRVVQKQPENPPVESPESQREVKSVTADLGVHHELEVPVEPPRETVEQQPTGVNENYLRYRVRDDGVEGLILNPKGEILRTIPPKDLMELVRENNVPSMGKLLDTIV